ncbi:MAG TPA: MFS transporter [Actinobacteria bacterium]|nr:MFS transporter [Actinomycetota bacterium]HCK78453.1 MFS transporter [Actinomycetota bacterium]
MSQSSDTEQPQGVRLQKVLAGAGVGSRRRCEQLIAQGRVEVDGHIIDQMGVRIDPLTAVVRVDGQRVNTSPERVYLALNKPAGVVTTMSDEHGRSCIGDFFGERRERLFHVGRLDTDTEGLLLLTNDGDLCNRLTHPSYGVQKVYLCQVQGRVAREVGRQLMDGVTLEDGPARADEFELVQQGEGQALVRVSIHEGRNRIVRRLLEAVGHPVTRLVRTQVGQVRLGDMRPGAVRPLTSREIAALYESVGL